LKTLEKINRKGNRNSREIEKTNSAQAGPFKPKPRPRPRPRAPCVRQAGPACRRQPDAPLSLSLSIPWARPVGASSLARRRPPLVPWPPLRPCPVQCHGELRLAVSYLGHPSVCPLPPCRVRSTLTGVVLAQSEPRRRRPEAPPHPRRSPSVSEFALEVSLIPMPLFRQVSSLRPRNCWPELVALPRNLFYRGLSSLAPPCRFCAHGRVCRVALNVSDPFPKPPEPRRGRSARLR
jgi:hypothetical protein